MMLGRQPSIRRNDDLPIGSAFDAENLEEGGSIGRAAHEQRHRAATPVGFARPRVFGVIDVIESVLLPQLRQRISLKSEREAEVEEGGILAEGDRTARFRDQLDGSLE